MLMSRIERIETIGLRVPLEHVFRGSYYEMRNRCTIITRVHTDAGVIGQAYNADTDVFKAEGRPDSAGANPNDTPLGSRVRGVFQPQTKDKDAKDGKAPKDAKSSEQAPNAPLPLKPDAALNEKSK